MRRPDTNITKRFANDFVNSMLDLKSQATFERRIADIIVKVVFSVYIRSEKSASRQLYTLTYSDDNNSANIVVNYRIFRSDNLHYVTQDFRRVINDYLIKLDDDGN